MIILLCAQRRSNAEICSGRVPNSGVGVWVSGWPTCRAAASQTEIGETSSADRQCEGSIAGYARRHTSFRFRAAKRPNRIRRVFSHAASRRTSPGARAPPPGTARRRPDAEANDNVVSVAHHDDVPMRLAFPPLVCPHVEGIVQVDGGQEWRDHRTWSLPRQVRGCANLPRCYLPVLHHPGSQQLADQSDHPPTSDPMFHEPDEPIVAHNVEMQERAGRPCRVAPSPYSIACSTRVRRRWPGQVGP